MPLTYDDDVGAYNLTEETLSSMIHHMQSSDMWMFVGLGIGMVIWTVFIMPLARIRKEIKTLQSKQDMVMYCGTYVV